VTVNQQVQHEYYKNIGLVLTEVNKIVMFIVPNIYYCGHTHTHSVSLSASVFSVYVTLNDLGTYIFVKPVPSNCEWSPVFT